jgi:hypothetical protein
MKILSLVVRPVPEPVLFCHMGAIFPENDGDEKRVGGMACR